MAIWNPEGKDARESKRQKTDLKGVDPTMEFYFLTNFKPRGPRNTGDVLLP